MRRSLLSVSFAALMILILPTTALAALHLPLLRTAGNYAVLAGTTITNTGPSWITGRLGLDPGSAITGFGPATTGPRDISNGASLQAKVDLVKAYTDAATETPFTSKPVELGGTTLGKGIYRLGTAHLTGTLTLNGPGVYVFQIGSSLVSSEATGARVHLINGANPCEVFWQVGSSATIGAGTAFVGTIMALTAITMNNRATLEGRALARNGAVNLHTNRIIMPGGCGYNAPASVPAPANNVLPLSLGFSLSLPSTGVPVELRGSFPWLLVIGAGGGLGAIALGVSSARRRRRTA